MSRFRRGEPGRIFVSNGFQFEGYTGGGNKEIIDGLMSTGDVGHFDEAGRLFIDGRDDEMIVSGGENVFPREIEELLLTHDAIDEAAAIGVSDEVHGQRLRAFVTCRAPTRRIDEDAGEATSSRRTWPGSRFRGRSSSSRRCRAIPPARSSSASWPSTNRRRSR